MVPNIPRDLKALERWVLWRHDWRDGRWAKPPYDVRTGRPAKVSDPSTWASFDTVIGTYAAHPATSDGAGWDGIGFVLVEGDSLSGTDLDHCWQPAERRWTSDEARRICEDLSSYAEFSPSGEGVHVWTYGTLPPGPRRRNGIEMYDGGRYLTVTGQVLPNHARPIEQRTGLLEAIWQRVFGGAAPEPTGGGQADHAGQTRATDDETREADRQVWQALFSDPRRGRLTRALFEGDTSGYASPSEADHGLLLDLARADPDPERMARRFKQSALYSAPERRAKHDAQHHADGRTYLHGSIEAAIKAVREEDAAQAVTREADPFGWPAPDPIFRTQAAPAPRLPLELLPDEMRQYAEDVAERRQSAPDYAVWPLLAAELALLGRGVVCRPRAYDDWSEPACLWVANIGEVSTLKSPMGEDGLWPLRRAEAEQRERYTLEHETWQQTCQALRAANPKIARRDLPEEPTLRVRLTSDSTVEKVSVLLAGHEQGLLLYRDELSGWAKDLNRYHKEGGDRQFWLQCYTGGPYTVNRITRDDVHVEQLLVGLVGGLQPDVARELLGSGPNDGFGARFVSVWPEVPQGYTPPRRGPVRAVQNALRYVGDRLALGEWRLQLAQDEFGGLPACAPDAEGQQLFDRWLIHFYTQWRAPNRERGGYLHGRQGKYPGLAARVMLAVHMHEWAAGRTPHVGRIEAGVVERALGLVMSYVRPMDQRVYGAFTNPPEADGGLRIARWILKEQRTSLSARDVYRHHWSEVKDERQAMAAIEWLVAHRWLREAKPEARPGRPENAFLVNPRVHEANL
jgi:hypothetical protein